MVLCKPQWLHTDQITGRRLSGDCFLVIITQPASGAHPQGPDIIIYHEIITLTMNMASKLPSGFAALET